MKTKRLFHGEIWLVLILLAFKEKTKIHTMDLRSTEKYNENVSNTKRYQSSAVPYMQRLLIKHNEAKKSLQN